MRSEALYFAIAYHFLLITDLGRARWGGSGALYSQSAIARPNSRSEAFVFLRLDWASGDEGWILRNLKLLNPVRPGREQR